MTADNQFDPQMLMAVRQAIRINTGHISSYPDGVHVNMFKAGMAYARKVFEAEQEDYEAERREWEAQRDQLPTLDVDVNLRLSDAMLDDLKARFVAAARQHPFRTQILSEPAEYTPVKEIIDRAKQEVIDLVLSIHKQSPDTTRGALWRGRRYCMDDHEAWPCATARALGVKKDE